MRRLTGDVWVAAILLGASGFFLGHLLSTPSSGGFVSTTTLPTAVAATMTVLAAALLGWSVWRAADGASAARTLDAARGGHWRVLALLVWTALDLALMPWLGYLATTAVYVGGLALLYGSRRPLAVVALMVLVPTVLLLFFERFMIVLLPAAQLFE
jgi:hypothetical protein